MDTAHQFIPDNAASPITQVLASFVPVHEQSEMVTLQFHFKSQPPERAAYAALKLARQLLNDRHGSITITDGVPCEIILAGHSDEVMRDLQWMCDIGWLDGAFAQQLLNYCDEQHRDRPQHRPVTQPMIERALDAFDFAVSNAGCNIDNEYGGTVGRLRYYRAIRSQLASLDTMDELAGTPYRLEHETFSNQEKHLDTYFSLNKLDRALRCISSHFVKQAKVQGVYSHQRRYLGPSVFNAEEGRDIDVYLPGDPQRSRYMYFELQNLQGITYEEACAMLEGMDAYYTAIRTSLGLPAESSAELQIARKALEKKNISGQFSVADKTSDLRYR